MKGGILTEVTVTEEVLSHLVVKVIKGEKADQVQTITSNTVVLP